MPKQFLDLSGLETYHTNISSYIDSKSVELTQDEYDDLVDEGSVDPDVTYYISDGVAPGSPVTDVKMNNVSIVSNHVANIPLVSSSTNGLVPQGTSVTTQSQSTKFLREDGSWQAPSYTSVSDRALIDGSNIVSPATFRANIGAITSVSTSNGDFVNLVANNEVWLVVVTRLTTSQSCIVIASMLNSTISVTEIFKSSNFSVVYNNQGTLGFKYNSSGTGVFGGAIKLN